MRRCIAVVEHLGVYDKAFKRALAVLKKEESLTQAAASFSDWISDTLSPAPLYVGTEIRQPPPVFQGDRPKPAPKPYTHVIYHWQKDIADIQFGNTFVLDKLNQAVMKTGLAAEVGASSVTDFKLRFSVFEHAMRIHILRNLNSTSIDRALAGHQNVKPVQWCRSSNTIYLFVQTDEERDALGADKRLSEKYQKLIRPLIDNDDPWGYYQDHTVRVQFESQEELDRSFDGSIAKFLR